METVVKFSTQFICKATGERVNITSLKMSRATHPGQDGGDGGGKRMDEISTDPNNPTTFQVNTSDPATCYYDEDCGGMTFDPDIVLEMDAAAAPESCGSFYWDPLLLVVDGDGQSASAVRQVLQPAGDRVGDEEEKVAQLGRGVSLVAQGLAAQLLGAVLMFFWCAQ